MELTPKDVPICKMIFNRATHEMGMLMYAERAKEIYKFVCSHILHEVNFFVNVGYSYTEILKNKELTEYFENYGLIDYSKLSSTNIKTILDNIPNTYDESIYFKLKPYIKNMNVVDTSSESKREKYIQNKTGYPKSILKYNRETGLHPR